MKRVAKYLKYFEIRKDLQDEEMPDTPNMSSPNVSGSTPTGMGMRSGPSQHDFQFK